MPLRKGSELFWLPVGSPLLLCDPLCAHSPGFAKKTFISYSVTFKENFRQGLVVEIDLQNQTVLLEDGEVSVLGADPTLSWLQEPPTLPRTLRLLGGGECRCSQELRELTVAPTWCRVGSRSLVSKGPTTAATECGGSLFLGLFCTPGTVLSLP